MKAAGACYYSFLTVPHDSYKLSRYKIVRKQGSCYYFFFLLTHMTATNYPDTWQPESIAAATIFLFAVIYDSYKLYLYVTAGK